MFPNQDKKKTIISGLIVGGLVLAIGFGVLRTQNLSTSQNYTSKAAPTSPITLITPSSGSTVGDVVGIEANFTPATQVDHLYAIAKVGDYTSIPLTIKSGETITLSGTLNTSSYKNGNYTLSVFVYTETGDTPQLVGRGDFEVIISH